MKNYVTKKGYDQLQSQLDRLVRVDAREAIEMIADAKDKGDLSENAEYEAAKAYQESVQIKIHQLSEKLRNSEIISTPKDVTSVGMLTQVELKNHTNGQNMIWSLVPENEIDIKNGKISFNSPIAAGLIGRKVGEMVDVKVPVGEMRFEILAIKPYL